MYVYLQRGKETIPLTYPGFPRDITTGPRNSVEGFLKIILNQLSFSLKLLTKTILYFFSKTGSTILIPLLLEIVLRLTSNLN